MTNFETIRANFVLGKVRYIVPNNHQSKKTMFLEEFLKNSFTLSQVLLRRMTYVKIRHIFKVVKVRYMVPNNHHLNNSLMEQH